MQKKRLFAAMATAALALTGSSSADERPAQAPRSGWTWQHPQPQGNPLYGVSFVNATTGWIVGGKGYGGTIHATVTGGIPKN